jgi:hypothetical protein
MKSSRGSGVVAALFAVAMVSCGGEVTVVGATEGLYGQWEKREQTLPPVTLSVRREGTATVGQVWLSGVTYTLPAVLDDTMVVLANPASSALAPFVGVLQKDGTMRATLRGQPDLVTTLHKIP